MTKSLKQETFVCLDCETTGLDPQKDKIIEVAVAVFNFDTILESFETLIDPKQEIPEDSIKIHHITQDMVEGKPLIKEVLPEITRLIGDHYIVGHGVQFDLDILEHAAKNVGMSFPYKAKNIMDTLRLARAYGQSPTNALSTLKTHFNIQQEGAHRAMTDVKVNIEVFKSLVLNYQTAADVLKELSKPILLPIMPLGKYKGRPLKEIPLDYLRWSSNQNFDQDLSYSIRQEIKKRKQGKQFGQATNPFHSL